MNKNAVVLVIDDCQDNLLLMELILISEGYRVETACNGKSGLAKINELCPDLIVLDIMMPDMSGLEVMDSIKTDDKLSEIPILLCTANQYICKENAGEANDICHKPFDINEMLVKIDSLSPCRKNVEVAPQLTIS